MIDVIASIRVKSGHRDEFTVKDVVEGMRLTVLTRA